jgi:hypothetical protein
MAWPKLNLTPNGNLTRSSFVNDQASDIHSWNLALTRQLFKAKQGELKLQAYDLLKQNRS